MKYQFISYFLSLVKSILKLDNSSTKAFTSRLSDHLTVSLITNMEHIPGIDKKKILNEKEGFWQMTLKSTTLYGGIKGGVPGSGLIFG